MKETLLKVSIQDAPVSRKRDLEALAKQCKVKAKKDEIKRKKNLEDTTNDHITAMHYHTIFHSEAHWKTATEVNQQLKKLKSKTSK